MLRRFRWGNQRVTTKVRPWMAKLAERRPAQATAQSSSVARQGSLCDGESG
jgi:hypothetical protein